MPDQNLSDLFTNDKFLEIQLNIDPLPDFNKWLKIGSWDKILNKRYIMYYPHEPGKIFELCNNFMLLSIINTIFNCVNIVFNKFGNKIQTLAIR